MSNADNYHYNGSVEYSDCLCNTLLSKADNYGYNGSVEYPGCLYNMLSCVTWKVRRDILMVI